MTSHVLVQIAGCPECVRALWIGAFEWLVSRMNANVSGIVSGIEVDELSNDENVSLRWSYLVKSPVQVNARSQNMHFFVFCLQWTRCTCGPML